VDVRQFRRHNDDRYPVATADSPFSVFDATIRLGDVDLVELTSFDLTLDISPSAPATFGPVGQKFSPDVFTAPLQVSMNIAALRKDLARHRIHRGNALHAARSRGR
jgi:hypothetical protein